MLAVYAANVFLAYAAYILIYRFFFHPLKHIPGPTLARATYLYEWYFDIYLSGQFTFNLKDLHKQYGPIIRINPDRVHIDDPDFIDKLYNQANGRTDKTANDAEAFGPYAAVSTTPILPWNSHLTSFLGNWDAVP